MRFDLTDDQRSLRDVVHRLLSRGPTGPSPGGRDLWRELGALGLTGIAAPAALGGADGDLLDVAVVVEQAGYHALAEPLMESAAVASPLLAHLAAAGLADDRVATWTARVVSGQARVALWLNGESLVRQADRADLFVIVHSGSLHLVGRAEADVEPVEHEDPDLAWGTVVARTGPDTAVSDDPSLVRQVHAWASLGTSSLLLGVSQCLLDRTVDYTRERRQFGRAIGSFQAVKHALADAAIDVEAARGLLWYAAHATTTGAADRWLAVDAVAGAVHDAADRVNRLALQLHGAIGFTQEFDLHVWLKRGLALRTSDRVIAAGRERIAAALLDGVEAQSGTGSGQAWSGTPL